MDRVTVKENDDIRTISKEIKTKMVAKKNDLHDKYVNTKWLKKRVLDNFIYKDPIAEWYIKIKWKFENKNYLFYDQLIGDRKKIYDIGCGYGYLSLYLHYRNQSRTITGIDYDKDKISIAENCFDKTQNLEFVQNDVSLLSANNADVFLFNDVLHYMSPQKQLTVLNKALDNLNPNGMILIRDGVKDLEKRHEKTKLTEYFSTKLFNFNKTENELSFFSINTIEKFAANNCLQLKTVEQSKKTSNILFILTKNG
jgi:2-polyprenyl-3-methyl-5-hydroxy-6-metoxy-1,4-benzoquinol methylase